jgi:single-strand DNA-binding protein
MSINVVHLVGRVGGDPEVRFFESGSVKCSLTLAVNRFSKNKDNEPPDWFNLELWGNTAQTAGNYVRKGSLIGIQGTLRIETWQDKTTNAERSKPVIRVDRLDLLGSKRDNDSNAGSNYSSGNIEM